MVKTTDALSQDTTTTYDAVGNIKSTTDELGRTTYFTYDKVDRLISTRYADNTSSSNSYDTEGNIKSTTDALARTTTFSYDSNNRLISTKDALNQEQQLVYDEVGNIISKTDALGHITKYYYDRNDNLINVREVIEVSTQIESSTIDLYASINGTKAYSSLATGDINDDGIDDIVTITASNDKLNVLLGSIANSLATKYTISTLPVNNATDIDRLELKDINGDSNLDLIANLRDGTSSNSGAILVFRNLGNGTFSAPESLNVNGSSDGFTTGDFNGDSKLDIIGHYTTYGVTFGASGPIVGPIANSLVLFAGNGSGGFTQQALNIPNDNTPTDPIFSIETIEINGKTNLIVNSADKLVIFERNTTGVWQNIDQNNGSFSNLVVGDLNGDGIADIIATESNNKIELLLGSSSGSFASRTFDPIDSSLKGINYLNLADTNKDGKLDLVTGYTKLAYTYNYFDNSYTYTENSLVIKAYNANANGDLSQLGTTKSIDNLPNSARQFVGMADINGDGMSDVLLQFSGSTNSIGVVRDNFNLDNFVSTSYTYDALDRQISVTDDLGDTQITSYDAVGNLIATTDALGHKTTYAYDSVGNRTAITDALDNRTNYVYDALDRQIKVIDAKNNSTTTAYDAVGNMLSITDSVGNKTSYTYDALDRQITDTNQFGLTRTYGYDAVGDLISSIDRNGRKRTYNYDALNRQTGEHWLDASGNDIRTFNYGYDAVGHLLTTNDPDSKYTYTYDGVDRVMSVDNLGTAGVPNVLLNYSYNAVGNLLSVTDRINGTLKGTNRYSYDILNRLTKLTQSGAGVAGKRVDMSYDLVNRLTGLSRYGDLAGTLAVADSSYSYDGAGRLKDLTHKRGATTIASYGFAYDNANRITQRSGTDGTEDYSYDETNQLTAVDHTNQADEAYSYDANGNRTNSGYSTGTNNQLLTDGTYNYEYDGEGNRTLRTEIATGKVTEYVWDYRNRLSSVVFKDAAGNVVKSIAYSYDVNDRRISKTIDGVVAERYVYDGENIALVFDGSGVQTHRYLYGTGVDQILADERGGSVVWALADNLGTVRDVVDGNGVVLNHVTYDSYGRVISQTNPVVEFRFGYTGREQDGETGLDYYRARYYDAGVGRFISEDPIGFNAGDANLYRYVGNSPTNAIDPSGNNPIVFPIGKVLFEVGLTIVGLLGTKKLIDDTFSPQTSPNPQPRPRTVPPLTNPPQKDKKTSLKPTITRHRDAFDPNKYGKYLPDFIPEKCNTGHTTIGPVFSPNDAHKYKDFVIPERLNTGHRDRYLNDILIRPSFSADVTHEPWRGKPVIHDGDSKKGWEHIESRHILGNDPKGDGDLFPPGTTRQQIEEAAKKIVAKGTRVSDPSKRIQSFEDRVKVNGQRDRVRVVVDSKTGEVITVTPIRQE